MHQVWPVDSVSSEAVVSDQKFARVGDDVPQTVGALDVVEKVKTTLA